MLIPSIDLQGGQTVQLIGGKELAIEAGNPEQIANNFGIVGELAVIDLDAAMGCGSNAPLIESLLKKHRCRVGGGIRDLDTAIRWLDAGAEKIIIGTAAKPPLLSSLPRERVIAAVDAVHGKVVVEGWTRQTDLGLLDQIAELSPYVGGFLVTFVEREGQLKGIDLEAAKAVVKAAGDAKVTIAGGVTTAEDIRDLDQIGADAQVGMALYTGKISLADGFAAPLVSDRSDRLWPTVVVDESGVALGLCWSNLESLNAAISKHRGIYWSRKRGLWEKGATSGASQELLRIDADCDRDALRFTVRQTGSGFCHQNTRSCWGDDWALGHLFRTLQNRKISAPEGSYTKRLYTEPDLLQKKLTEEMQELIAAKTNTEILNETGDVMFFTLTNLAKYDLKLEDVERILKTRSLKVTRRPGNAKW